MGEMEVNMANSPDFAEIIILTVERSGSNMLSDMLRQLDGNCPLFEIFRPGSNANLAANEGLFDALNAAVGQNFDGPEDPRLAAYITAHKPAFFAHLSDAARSAGYQSISCKFFLKHLTDADLAEILARPNVRVIFLLRSRIDQHISLKKALLTKTFVRQNTTEITVNLTAPGFLRAAGEIDIAFAARLDLVKHAARPYTVLEYERDLNTSDRGRTTAVAAALAAIGIAQSFAHYSAPNWLDKQDLNRDWRDKIVDGAAISADLAQMGLLEYAEALYLSDLLPSTGDRSLSTVSITRAAYAGSARRDALLDEGGYFRAASADPLITFSGIQFHQSYFAQWMHGPDPAFEGRKGVHFLSPTWTMQTVPLDVLADNLRQAEGDNPGHIFIALHVNDAEAANYSRAGIRSILCNSSMFEDDQKWQHDAPPHPRLAFVDALYVARLDAMKNHHLASQVRSAHFVYGRPEHGEIPISLAETCPNAHFLNHLLGPDGYKYISHDTLGSIMSCAKTGLALSFEEGNMRACIEYQMAGLPVVSVPSIGGRDAFFTDDTALIVAPTPQAVRDGVAELIARRLTRSEVRRATMAMLRAMRGAFEAEANCVIADHLGPLAPHMRVADIIGFSSTYRPLRLGVEALL